MERTHNMVKHFSSIISNRKNYDSVFEEHHCAPANQLEQDHNGTMIVAVHKLLKSVLRTKGGTLVYYHQFNMPQFLAEDEWETLGVLESILRDTLRLISVFQHEEKLNGECGPVMWKSLK